MLTHEDLRQIHYERERLKYQKEKPMQEKTPSPFKYELGSLVTFKTDEFYSPVLYQVQEHMTIESEFGTSRYYTVVSNNSGENFIAEFVRESMLEAA